MKHFNFKPINVGESIDVICVDSKIRVGSIDHTENIEGFRWEFVPTIDYRISLTTGELCEISHKIDLLERDWRAGRVKQIIENWSITEFKKAEFTDVHIEDLARCWKFRSNTVRSIWLEIHKERSK